MPCAPGRHPGLAPYGTSSRSRRIRLAGHAGLGRLAMQTETGEEREGKPHVAVVGAGWGGWAAAKALCENGCAVTLLDSLPDPAGERPWLTPSGKPFEPGQRGYYAERYYRDGRYYQPRSLGRNDRIYRGMNGRYYCRRNDGTTGLVVGGLAGGALGNVIAGGGSRLLGTLIGAGGGALLGQQIDRGQVRCR